VGVPVVVVVAARPAGVGADPRSERGAQRLHSGLERVRRPGVDPQPGAAGKAARIGARRGDHVVAGEVVGVVEGAPRRLAAAAPERGRVAAHGAEAARVEPGDVIGPEPAHRDPADRDAVRIGSEAPDDLRDHLARDVAAPVAVGAVVPVGVVAAVRERDDRRVGAGGGERREERFVELALVVARASVQEDQQRSSARRPIGGDDDGRRQPPAHRFAVDLERRHGRAVAVDPEQLLRDEADADRHGDQHDRQKPEAAHSPARPGPAGPRGSAAAWRAWPARRRRPRCRSAGGGGCPRC
jgi:hypothetical protein